MVYLYSLRDLDYLFQSGTWKSITNFKDDSVAFHGGFMKGVVTMLLMLKIGPLKELVMKGLEQVNMGRGLATVKTIAMRMVVILLQVLQAF
ncbi:hypothetical protein Sjap_008929 [Stephania japonica]|uniref:Uncharacterized protein n=1 Tax=Stephania japonica TaxID=461633 RepID=A0AAP0JRB9_9MAGN